MHNCPKCGAQIGPDDRFCGACGSALSEEPTQEAAPAASSDETPPTTTSGPAPPVPAGSAVTSKSQDRRKIAYLVLAILAVGIGWFILTRGRPGEDSSRTRPGKVSSPAPALTPGRSATESNRNQQGYNVGFAFVDMNRIFKEFDKTKSAEAKINEAKNAAKQAYNEKADKYEKDLEEINALANDAPDREQKIAALKKLEQEINEFRATREKELQDQARKLRNEIVDEITKTIRRLTNRDTNFVLDAGGMSLNGVPLVLNSPSLADMSDRVITALNAKSDSTFLPLRDLRVATVDMNAVFKRLDQTKKAETEVNEAKAQAKKEYDQRADGYRKLLNSVNSSSGRDRSVKIAKLKAMEHDINEFRKNRERELQEQSLTKRTAIVTQITNAIKAEVGNENRALVFDRSGMSQNGGLPAVICGKQIPDLSNEIVDMINNKSGPKQHPTQLKSSQSLRFGLVDMGRVFRATPEGRDLASELEKKKTELASADANTRAAKEKEMQEFARKKREELVAKFTATIDPMIEVEQLVFDSTGQSLNGVPFVLLSSDLPDLTDTLISRLPPNLTP